MDGKQACILMVSPVPSPSPEIHLQTSGPQVALPAAAPGRTLLKHN